MQFSNLQIPQIAAGLSDRGYPAPLVLRSAFASPEPEPAAATSGGRPQRPTHRAKPPSFGALGDVGH